MVDVDPFGGMCCCFCCCQPSQCRIRFAPGPLLFLTTLALTLSLLSTLDCQFLNLVVGFRPDNSEVLDVVATLTPGAANEESQRLGVTATTNGDASTGTTISLGVGLWTFENPAQPGWCLTYSSASSVQGITNTDDLYHQFFSNSDRPWTMSRLFAVLGMLCGAAAVTVLTIILCKSKRRSQMKYFAAQAALLAFLCETIKFGLFFNIQYCTAAVWWHEESGEYHTAERCELDRGSRASLASFLIYLAVTTLIVMHLIRPPNESHRRSYTQEEATLPSYLKSVGKSVGSSKNSSKESSGMRAVAPNWRDIARKAIPKQDYDAVPPMPPPQRVEVNDHQSAYTGAISSVGMGTLGHEGHASSAAMSQAPSYISRHTHHSHSKSTRFAVESSSRHLGSDSAYTYGEVRKSRRVLIDGRMVEQSRRDLQGQRDGLERIPSGGTRSTRSSSNPSGGGSLQRYPSNSTRGSRGSSENSGSRRTLSRDPSSSTQGSFERSRRSLDQPSTTNTPSITFERSALEGGSRRDLVPEDEDGTVGGGTFATMGAGTSVGMGTVGIGGRAGDGRNWSTRRL